jgi:polyphenol oxidase
MDIMKDIDLLQVEQWKQYKWLRHGFSTRSGGVSTIYGGHSLNLGWTKEDEASSVTENRRRFVSALADKAENNADPTLVCVRQIHSDIIHLIKPKDGAPEGKLASPDGKALLEGDGLITDTPGLLLGVGTADCVPVLLVDVNQRIVAAFHAGWRGTVARIVEQGVARMLHDFSSQPQDLLAAVGPSIGPCCYSVGDEVRAQFHSNFRYADKLFHEVGVPPASVQLHLDLWEANRQQLIDAGLSEQQITLIGACTACSRDTHGARRFFSHRAEHGHAGRMLNAIGIAKQPPSDPQAATK